MISHTIERLPILILDVHSRCNCRCAMCDIWSTSASTTFTFEALERQVPELQALGVEWVVFSGGEPLMNPDLRRMNERLQELGIRTTLLTTGLLLARNAEWIATSVHDVILSLDGPREVHDAIRGVRGAFEQAAGGAEALRRINPHFPVSARCTVQKRNHAHLAETAVAARNLGLTSISFLAADLTSEAFNRPGGWDAARQSEIALTPPEIEVLECELDALMRLRASGATIAESDEKLRRIAQHFRAYVGLAEDVAPRCNAPWTSAVIEPDGRVRPCFFHPPQGSVSVQPLRSVLNSAESLHFRQALDVARNPICRSCVCSLYREQASGRDHTASSN
ncbi:MAG TPA: radical SAM protein [Bryobacteraceae bacterium]|nr:radical SAM protein [Bryobacteraceae bacterium]